jgi:hypothetical protein
LDSNIRKSARRKAVRMLESDHWPKEEAKTPDGTARTLRIRQSAQTDIAPDRSGCRKNQL